MKKYLAIFLMLAMAAGCLGGCSGAPGAGGPDTEPGQTAEPGTADLKESEPENTGSDIAEPGKTEPLDADPEEGTGGSSSSGSGSGSVGSGSGAGSVGSGSEAGSTGAGSDSTGDSGSTGGSSKPSSNTGSSSSKPSGTGSSSSKPTGGTGTNSGSSKPSNSGSGSSKPSNSGNGSAKPTEPKPTEPKPTEHTHSYSVSSRVEPTCTAAGSVTYTCSCGSSYQESIPATGHPWQTIHHDEVGHWLSVGKCTCGYTFSTTKSGDALAYLFREHCMAYDLTEQFIYHPGYANWAEWIVDVPAYDTWVCPVCGVVSDTQP